MFEIAVLGTIAGNPGGVVSQCIQCRARLAPGAAPCRGFGPGCLGAVPARAFSKGGRAGRDVDQSASAPDR